MTLDKKLSLVLIAVVTAFCAACTSTREPVSMVEPSYSHMRNIQQQTTVGQAPINELTTQTTQAVPEDMYYSSDNDLDSVIEPQSDEEQVRQQLLADQLGQLNLSTTNDFLFEMARVEP